MSNVMLNIDEFLKYLKCELNRSQKTIDSYAEDLKSFEAYFKNLSDSLSWETVDSDVIRNWMESMMDRGNKATSVSRRLSSLRTFFRYALTRHLVNSDPAHKIRPPKTEKPLPQFLKENEMDNLLDRQKWGDDFNDVRARTIIITFYETGMRLSELLGLDDESVDFVNREIKVTGKGDKQRVIPFGKELLETLQDYMRLRDQTVERKSSALFLSETGKRMSPNTVRAIVKQCLSRVSSLKKKSPHVLRHTFATAMLNHDAEIESLKRLLGHAKLSTTEIYTHTTFEQLKRVYTEAHPRA